jgi:hypothetical protein
MGVLSLGGELHYSTVDANSFTELAGIINITRDGTEITSVPTHVLKTAWEEFRAGRKKAGTLTFSLKFTAANGGILHGFANAGTHKDWKVELSDGSTFVCEGFITKLGDTHDEGDSEVVMDVTIQFTGQPTFTAAS